MRLMNQNFVNIIADLLLGRIKKSYSNYKNLESMKS